MRLSISLLILLIICSFSQAQETKFKDLSQNHWAEGAVYNLVKRGITFGYPGQTYKGLNNMTRQEMAVFLSNLAKQIEKHPELEKLIAELKTEMAELKYEDENPQSLQIKGEYLQRIFVGNPTVPGPKGPRLDFRLKLSLFEKLGQSGSVKANFDTTDAGFAGGSRNIFPDLFDFEGRLKLGRLNLKAAIGPGYLIHRETDGILPSEDLRIFNRPKTSFNIQTYFQNLDASLGYIAHQTQSYGEITTSEVQSRMTFTYDKFPLLGKTTVSFVPSYFWNSAGKSFLSECSILSNPLQTFDFELMLGAGRLVSSSGLMAKAVSQITLPSTSISIAAYKIGSEYRSEINRDAILYFNIFDKQILDGSTDIDILITQKIRDGLSLIFKSSAIMTTLTSEFGLTSAVSEKANFKAFYRTYTSDTIYDLFGVEAEFKL